MNGASTIVLLQSPPESPLGFSRRENLGFQPRKNADGVGNGDKFGDRHGAKAYHLEGIALNPVAVGSAGRPVQCGCADAKSDHIEMSGIGALDLGAINQ